ncbi:MAG: EAL domain-containing protein [Betaproteobacteria bacterium]|nr:EAL domain-containing protein [Betaproteobacteria bacterium]
MTNGTARSPAASGEEKFLEEMNRELAGWDDPAARLRHALARDDLQLYCQPILSLRPPGAFTMAEALVRLREEEALLLPPGDFLPVFEHFGMMGALDRWVASHVVRWLADPPAGAIPRISLNVSAQALEDAAFPGFIAGELQAMRVPPQALTFEVDENDTLSRLEVAARFSHAVKQIGCKVLIDGFGQRSVSFIALQTLRADFVKVDGAIVRALLRSEVARHKLKAVVRVGQTIGVEVIAECVEEPGILAQLREARVGYAQGFGIARPAPIDRSAAPRMP